MVNAYAGYSGGGRRAVGSRDGGKLAGPDETIGCTEICGDGSAINATTDDTRCDPPCYDEIQDHTEAVYVEYDPAVVTYEQLVLQWTKLHDPTTEQSLQQI